MKIIMLLILILSAHSIDAKSSLFKAAVNDLFCAEGGLADLKDDTGGITNYGVSSKVYGERLVRNLTKKQAENIFYKDYWKKIKGDELANYKISSALLDSAINTGAARTVRMLQRILRVPVDGVIGSETLNRLYEHNPTVLLLKIKLARIEYHVKICEYNRTQCKFIPSWVNRTLRSRCNE